MSEFLQRIAEVFMTRRSSEKIADITITSSLEGVNVRVPFSDKELSESLEMLRSAVRKNILEREAQRETIFDPDTIQSNTEEAQT